MGLEPTASPRSAAMRSATPMALMRRGCAQTMWWPGEQGSMHPITTAPTACDHHYYYYHHHYYYYYYYYHHYHY